ncbi:lamin tail domain-containing protein [Candidatus Gottesmanbacteria bacterium]|nr:lamin tail domain-containing protein [Candidatus Gottesmanbacteria bacterium]
MKKILFLFAPSLIFLSLLSSTKTYSLFSDTAISSNNTFTAAEEFPNNHLVINEVMFNPDNPFCTGGEPASEWVEIYNPTSTTVNLDGWTIHDNTNSDVLPNVSLNSGSFAIIANCSQSEFTGIWNFPPGTLYIDLGSAIGSGLANGGDEVRLDDNNELTVDHVSYGSNINAFNPSVSAPITNHTIERNPIGFDTNSAGDFVDRNPPTPGS